MNEKSRLTLMDMPKWLYKGQELSTAECEILGIVGILRLDEG
jgi:hypothetical protein